jgi:hypothetical protein
VPRESLFAAARFSRMDLAALVDAAELVQHRKKISRSIGGIPAAVA